MRKVIVDLNKNIVTLNDKFAELLHLFYDKQTRKLLEKLITRSSRLFFDVTHAAGQMKWDKVVEIILGFLDEADAFLRRIALDPFDLFVDTTRELLQVVRAQVIFVDQYRQSHFVF